MLREIFYTGVIEYLPWEVKNVPGHHEPIISMETYEKNQKRLSQRPGTFIRRDVREGYELRGFINCSTCNVKLTGAPSTNGRKRKDGKEITKYDYYKCRNKKCIELGKSILNHKLDQDFATLMKSIKPCTEVIDLASEILNQVWKEEMQNEDKQIDVQRRRKLALTEQISTLAERVSKTQNEVVISQYEKQLEKLTLEENEIDENLDQNYDFKIPFETATKEVLSVLKDPYSVWIKYNIHQKQRFYNFMFEGNLSYSRKEGFETINYALPIRLFEQISTSNTVDVEVGGVEPPCAKG